MNSINVTMNVINNNKYVLDSRRALLVCEIWPDFWTETKSMKGTDWLTLDHCFTSGVEENTQIESGRGMGF